MEGPDEHIYPLTNILSGGAGDAVIDTVERHVNVALRAARRRPRRPTPRLRDPRRESVSSGDYEVASLASSTVQTLDEEAIHASPTKALKLKCRNPLSHLYQLVGSGTALLQLSEACAASNKEPPRFSEDDCRSIVMWLFHIDAVTSLHQILRRYLLVRLLTMRHETARRINCTCRTCEASREELFAGPLRSDMGHASTARQRTISFETDSMSITKAGRRPCLALDELLRDVLEGPSKVKYRRRIIENIHLARPWYRLAAHFGVGILALVPTVEACGISSSKSV